MGRAADSSLMETAEEHDVLEEIEVLRELAVKSKKATYPYQNFSPQPDCRLI